MVDGELAPLTPGQIQEIILTGVLFQQPMLDPVILTTIQDVRSVEEKDLKDKVNSTSSQVGSRAN
jgi:hypothetical protein